MSKNIFYLLPLYLLISNPLKNSHQIFKDKNNSIYVSHIIPIPLVKTIMQVIHSFNLHIYTKCDPKFFTTASRPFQSTHPCRMQLQHIKIDTALVQISIHAPTQNATRIFQDFLLIIRISIHAFVQNATAIVSTIFAFLYTMCSS